MNRLNRYGKRKHKDEIGPQVATTSRDRDPANLSMGLPLSDRGQALAETAVSLSLFLMVVMGIFSFGIVFYQYLTLTSAVGSGAQNLQQIASTTSDPCADTLTAIEDAAPNLKTSSLGLTVVANGTTYSGTSCSGVTPASKSSVTVTATYPCNYKIINFVYSSCLLSASSTEYIY
jgi:Flp pilus assembly protein TadG